MLKEIINKLNKDIKALNQFSVLHGLCDIINDGKGGFPAEYCGKDEYKQVSNFDQVRGVIYHRMNGDITREEIEEESLTGCENLILESYPMLLIGCIKMSILKIDDAYTDLDIAQKISNTITNENIKGLNLGLRQLETNVELISINRKSILETEYPDNESDVEIPYDFAYFKVEYNIKAKGEITCFTTCK